MSVFNEKRDSSALYAANAGYIEDVQSAYEQDPAQVGDEWRDFFANGMGAGGLAGTATSTGQAGRTAGGGQGQMSVSRLIDSYRLLGNRIAATDPLMIDERPRHPSLEMSSYSLGEKDLDTYFETDIPGLPTATLREIVDLMTQVYCGPFSAEFMYITDPVKRQWFARKVETNRADPGCDDDVKRHLLERLVAADALENYINTRFTGQKRFSLEGGDALIPMLDELTREAARTGVKETCIGMAHRGRLNVLINVFGKNPSVLFDEFEGKNEDEHYGSGDVKYHKGFSSKLTMEGNVMHMALQFNPSHLEIVNPVVEGSVWARQNRRKDSEGSLVLPVLIHGDAALAGQGIGMETLNMSQTRGYSTGGTVHITVNNQVGFTTSHIADARSTYWCTDLAKMAEAPVIHVNGNNPESCRMAILLALEYRNKFRGDVFVDLVCYRRHGHNEQDEPKVTQPYMYSKVSKLKNPAGHYAARLVEEGVIEAGEEKRLRDSYVAMMKEGKSANPLTEQASSSEFVDWSKHIPTKSKWDDPHDTSLDEKQFSRLGGILSTVPEGFKPHSRVKKIIDNRAQMATGELDLDWGMAENLAYVSLVDLGYGVRLSGQDIGRGTFFHRHAVWHDQGRDERDGHIHVPMEHVNPDSPCVKVVDSLLSEAAVLGFEYGVSLTSPDVLVVWEAQFGDFANSAQVVIDQFISSGEFKWGRLSGLVMLLPHGYEGQGPEHSSARLERYMQLCAEYNMTVCVPSTASQIFHLLRRQMINPLRRPLVIMTPKSMLRKKEVASPKSEFTEGAFRPIIAETDDIDPKKVREMVVCSGKIYYELRQARRERSIDDIAIIRLEQVYPFPHDLFEEQVKLYSKATMVRWCQEEPGNQGAWHRIQHYMRRHLQSSQQLRYSLRRSSASTATGHGASHRAQQQEVIDAALA